MSSGISDEKAWRRRSWGEGMLGSSRGALGSREASDGCGTSRGSGSGAGGADGCSVFSGSRPSSAVDRKSAASGPSRMLARLPLAIGENLLREIAIGLGRHPVRIVLEHRHPTNRRLGEAHGLLDAGGEHAVAEVLLEDLDRLLGV